MIDKLDKALEDLTDIALNVISEAKEKNYFDRDFAEGVCIILTMAYNRWGNGDGK